MQHCALAAAFFTVVLLPSAAMAEVRAGAAKRVITPDLKLHGPVYMAGFDHNRKATGIHDDLFVRCAAFSTGSRPLVLCGADLIGLFHDDVRKIRAKVDADIVIAALHDHEGPDTMGLWGPTTAETGINETYLTLVVDRAVEAANEAIRTMRPARLRLAKVRTPELDTFVHDTRPPVVHDPEIIALQADTLDGKPIATLINWANHPETLGSKNTLVTADYPGYLYKEAEKLLGGTTVFINGAVGGMQSPLGSTIKNVSEATFEKAEFIGSRVAQLAAEALRKTQPAVVDSIAYRETLVQIPMPNQGFQMASKAGIFAGRKPPNPDGTTTTPVGYIRFSRRTQPELEIALVPGELYPELSVGGVEHYPGADFPDAPVETPLKQMLTAPYRMLFGLANDENGYIIPKSEWDEKAPWLQDAAKHWYGEVNSLGPDAAPIIAKAFQDLVLRPPTAVAQAVVPVAFNRDIRPILSDKCFTCHGPDAAHRKTKVRFDIEGGARSVATEIVRRVAALDTAVRMPPAYAGRDRLKDSEIELIRRWVEQGAVWQPFWSLIPPQRPAPPAVRDAAWVRNPIDSFILARLESRGLHPQPEADRSTLVRRVTLDLTGLPPTPAEVDAFLSDRSPDAYGKVVDRLLASPRYGERMAFRWMEAARYGDTNGYQTDGPRDMWRWRDWVIDAFNRNMPYDRFTIEQLAGDLLPNATLEQRIATGFNRNHRTSGEGGIIPEEYRVEYVADRAQTTSTVWLGLTVGCARCHDHKYDPIAQKDFYRLFAYFNQVPNEKGFVWNYGNEEPLVKAPLPEQARKLAELDEKIAAFRLPAPDPGLGEPGADWTIQDGLVYRHLDAHQFDGKDVIEADGKLADFDYMQPFTFAAWIRPEEANGAIITHAEDFFEGMGHGLYLVDGKIRLHIHRRWTDLGIRVESAAPVALHERQHVLVTYDGERKAAGVRIYLNGKPVALKILFDQNTEPIHAKAPLRIGGGGGLRFKGEIADARVYNRALTPIEAAIDVSRPARQAAYSLARPMAELAALQRERKQFYDSIPSVMVMADGAARDTFLLKRGAYDAPGEKVASGVPGILPPLPPGSTNDRLGLARWLVDRGNPLTARVTVNRFWQSYFGYGIVKTVDDFGAQGEFPVHPELLDWLAVEFMESGWDVKKLQKTIVTSAAYRQSSRVTPELLQRDPDNRLLARGPRFRLGPEMIRDQALAISGLLVEKIGGPSVKPYQPAGLWQELGGGSGYKQEKGEGLYRRSLYTYWKRTIAPPFMVNFDSPNREQCTVFENRTNSPLQALDLMNDVTFVEAARKLAERMMADGGVDYGFKLVLARLPKAEERRVITKALEHFRESYRANPTEADELLKQGDSPVREGLDRVELAAFTSVASLLLNLDEVVTKQ